MGLLAEFFVARPEALTPQVLDRGPDGSYRTLPVNGMTDLHVALLLAAIENALTDEVIDCMQALGFEQRDAGPEGPWLTRLPETLRDRLFDASSAQLQAWAERWLAFEEFSDASADDVTAFLERLGDLAREARAGGAAMYLWTCL